MATRPVPPPPTSKVLQSSSPILPERKILNGSGNPISALLKRPPPSPRPSSTTSSNDSSDVTAPRRLPPHVSNRKESSLLDSRISGNGPPPIPWHTKPAYIPPDLESEPELEVHAEEEPEAEVTSDGEPTCLLCQDFTREDTHASRFPRQNIKPTLSAIRTLAHDLTSPFNSLTSKARVIFSWMHFNIVYDTEMFFSGNLKACTPTSTLQSGLAVCEGYAGLFTQFAVYAGLDCITVHGHGKGYGIDIDPHVRVIPKFEMNHAWNAIRLDNGEMKLIDSCWGAGAISGSPPVYAQTFNPAWFSMSNRLFGFKHYPTDSSHWFLDQDVDEEGQPCIPQTWAEYITTDGQGRKETPPVLFGRVEIDHGISERDFQPSDRNIDTSMHPATSLRFQVQKICAHTRPRDPVPFVFVLAINNASDYIPFETNGFHWWTDVELGKLGKSGGKVLLYTVTSMGGVDARGASIEEYKKKKGKVPMGFAGVASWDLV